MGVCFSGLKAQLLTGWIAWRSRLTRQIIQDPDSVDSFIYLFSPADKEAPIVWIITQVPVLFSAATAAAASSLHSKRATEHIEPRVSY